MRQKRKNYSYFKRKISDFVYLCIEHIKLAPIRGQFLLIRKYFCPTSEGCMCLRHNGKAFTRRSELDSQELRKLQSCQRQCNGRCSRDVFIHIPYYGYGILRIARCQISVQGIVYSYRRGLRRCSFRQDGQCEGL